jgi:hydroxypyruvate isomerase
MSVEELARHAAQLGYRSIELLAPKDWATVKRFGLTCAICTGTGPITIKSCLNRKENHGPCIAELRKNIELAAEAGVPSVICFSGNRDGMPDDVGLDHCAQALEQVVGLAEKKRVNVCMEILNSKVNHKDYMFDRMDWGVELVKRVGSPRFGILYDIYHAQIMEGDVIRTIRTHHEHILHYHTGGNPGRNEIDRTQELNYTAIVKAIVETGYTGYLGQEFIPKRDPVESLAQAFAICDV